MLRMLKYFIVVLFVLAIVSIPVYLLENNNQSKTGVPTVKDSERQHINQERLSYREVFSISTIPNDTFLKYRAKIFENIDQALDVRIEEIAPKNMSIDFGSNIRTDLDQFNTISDVKTSDPQHVLTVMFDNDIFNNTDYYYTNGVNIRFINPSASRSPLSKLLAGSRSSDINMYGFSIMQNIYTPTNPDIAEISTGDRPFSAFLTIGQLRETYSFSKKLAIKSSLNFGVLGPASLGGVVQSSIHNIEPIGWTNQIQNDFVIDYTIDIEKGIISNPNFEFNITTGGNIGTLFNKIYGGVFIRTGKFTPVYRGSFTLSDNKSKSGAFQYWVFLKGNTNLVLYDATLQGGFTTNNNLYTINSSDINRVVLNFSAGLAMYYKSIGVELENFYLSPEFKNAYDFRWGRIKLVLKL